MLPDPLHPAVVHFPVVLAFVLPVAALVALWTILKGARIWRAWSVAVIVSAALALSSWVAVETGETDAKRVERVVQESLVDGHEEAAEAFLTGSVIVLVISVAGLLGGLAGTVSRIGATIGAVGLVAGVAYIGHSGGQLVYKHGAASAYTSPTLTGALPTSRRPDD